MCSPLLQITAHPLPLLLLPGQVALCKLACIGHNHTQLRSSVLALMPLLLRCLIEPAQLFAPPLLNLIQLDVSKCTLHWGHFCEDDVLAWQMQLTKSYIIIFFCFIWIIPQDFYFLTQPINTGFVLHQCSWKQLTKNTPILRIRLFGSNNSSDQEFSIVLWLLISDIWPCCCFRSW